MRFKKSFDVSIAVIFCASLLSSSHLRADDFRVKLAPLVKAHCLHCHDGSDDNGLDLTKLKKDLRDIATYRKWVKFFDRVDKGEMPPKTEDRPPSKLVRDSLAVLKAKLRSQNLAEQRSSGRSILRRLTQTEYQNTINDLLGINVQFRDIIPAETNSSSFDTVFSGQGLSRLHVQSYLEAADVALDAAIQLQQKPTTRKQRWDYTEHELIKKHLNDPDGDRPVVLMLDDGAVMFDTMSWLFKPDFHCESSGKYIIRCEAYSYQSEKPVILTLGAGDYKRGTTEMLGYFDLVPDESRTVQVVTHLDRGQYIFPGAEDLEFQADGETVWNTGPEKYEGSGIVVKWLEIEGPIVDQWPPKRTINLLKGIELKTLDSKQWDARRQLHINYEITPGDNPEKQLDDVIAWLAPRAFRRPLKKDERKPFVNLGIQMLGNGRSFDDAIRTSLRAILSSPQFLFAIPEPGELDEFSLASRLSYFLWKSMPDDKLLSLAYEKKLSDPKILRAQVERLLDHKKAKRFTRDFVDQWLQLGDINETAPDMRLYPEYDDVLQLAMLSETEMYFTHLIKKDLGVEYLIDSDFSFLNRRLAEHYGIANVDSQKLERVVLPSNSPRGGLLTQASVLKVTANGTTTSPVRRGSWVLTHILGQPPSPPPPSVGSIEPDTRGASTIRELLEKHRTDESCSSCHQHIDPPGFAMESFDVIGGFRTRFRNKEHGDRVEDKLFGRHIWEYKLGLPVDSSGTLTNGKSFSSINEYKRLLLNDKEQIARNLISKLVVYSTGAKIQFSDRDEIEKIMDKCRKSGFGVRTLIHEVVRSRLFRYK